jgi:hypothetical protein
MRLPAKRDVATVSDTKPIVCVVPVRRPTDTMFGRYWSRSAVFRTRCSTSREIRISGPRPERTNDAVVGETPAALATSASVTRRALIAAGPGARAPVAP